MSPTSYRTAPPRGIFDVRNVNGVHDTTTNICMSTGIFYHLGVYYIPVGGLVLYVVLRIGIMRLTVERMCFSEAAN